ncbi:MAG: hypothetical protein JJE09_10475 [Bacteroidia bacterium]|nr:hypothetical protein [Bacteroidia bacterium]
MKQRKWDEATTISHHAIDFATRTKPEGWETTIQHFKEDMNQWKKD